MLPHPFSPGHAAVEGELFTPRVEQPEPVPSPIDLEEDVRMLLPLAPVDPGPPSNLCRSSLPRTRLSDAPLTSSSVRRRWHPHGPRYAAPRGSGPHQQERLQDGLPGRQYRAWPVRRHVQDSVGGHRSSRSRCLIGLQAAINLDPVRPAARLADRHVDEPDVSGFDRDGAVASHASDDDPINLKRPAPFDGKRLVVVGF